MTTPVRIWVDAWGGINIQQVNLSNRSAEAAEAKVEALVELLREARSDLAIYVDADWPENLRATYPSCERKYQRDMELCRRIDAAIQEASE